MLNKLKKKGITINILQDIIKRISRYQRMFFGNDCRGKKGSLFQKYLTSKKYRPEEDEH